MDLYNAILKSGLVTEERLRDLSFTILNNSGNRTEGAATTRYLINLQEIPVCSIKKLVRSGIYNIDLMIQFQKVLHDGDRLRSPIIYCAYETEDYIYIVEEYIAGDSLSELIQTEALNLEAAVTIVKQVYELMHIQPICDLKQALFHNEIDNIYKSIDKLYVEKDLKLRIQHDLHVHIKSMLSETVMTNGDFWLKNIIIKNDDIYLVDFDLTHLTQMGWVDLLRLNHYAGHSNIVFSLNEFSNYFPRNIDLRLLGIVFLLLEIDLQSRILDQGYFPAVLEHLQAQLIEICEDLYQIEMINNIESEPIDETLEGLSEYVQLYWINEKDQGFNEVNSIRVPVMINEWETYSLHLETSCINSIRIDPINTHGIIEIKRIYITNNSTDVDLKFNEDIKVGGTLQTIWSQNGFRGISIGEDPQLFIDELNINGKVTVSIEMKVTKDIANVFNVEFLRHFELIDEIELRYQDLKGLHSEMVNKTAAEIYAINSRVAVFEKENQDLRNDISYLRNSRSWRWTSPIRGIVANIRNPKGNIKKLYKKMMGERMIELLPIHQLERNKESNYQWIATGNDPQFEWSGRLFGGWIQLFYRGQSEEPATLQLYYDSGEAEGMTATSFINIGSLYKEDTMHGALIKLPHTVKRLRLDPGERPQRFSLYDFKVRKVSSLEILSKPIRNYIRNNGLSYSTFRVLLAKFIQATKQGGVKGAVQKVRTLAHSSGSNSILDYEEFIRFEYKTTDEWNYIKKTIDTFSYKPLISILVPVYNVDEQWLRLCVESVQKQVYPNWELCLVDDCSPKAHIKKVLTDLAKEDNRIKIKFREENGHISKTSNDALLIAQGEFVALLDHDDELSPDALYENIRLLNEYTDADIIYSDEDKISMTGERHSPFFKPDWSPDMLMSHMYTCHLTLYRTSIVEQVGGFRVGYEGSQDFDLMLRATEVTKNIHHIPKVLYHWRAIPSSTAMNSSTKDYTHMAGLRALEDTIKRRRLPASVESVEGQSNVYLVRYKPITNPKVSIIIPTRNMTAILSDCLNSIFEKTSYANFEVIIIDNGSNDKEIFNLYKHWEIAEPARFKYFSLDIPFNYSKLNNYGVNQASGELILLLNNDVTVITPDWLTEMAGQAMRPEIGAVGANLYYPDDTLQHGGVVLGVGGIAGHSHKHYPADHPGYFCRLKVVSNYTAVTAACLMVRKKIFEEVGGLEETLQVAFNDVDFCLKVWESGYYNVWLPQVKLYHYESKSRGSEDTPEKQQRFNGEIEWMNNRWSHLLINDPTYNPNLSRIRDDFSLGTPSNTNR